jgi:hypothetical protein
MSGKIWMAKDTDTLMALAHLPNAMIAVQTGHCVETVQRKRSALGLPNYYAVRYGTWADLNPKTLNIIESFSKIAP